MARKYKKTIRRSVQDKTAKLAQKHIAGYTKARILRRKVFKMQYPDPMRDAREAYMNSLTNWQRNKLLGIVKHRRLDTLHVDLLKAIVVRFTAERWPERAVHG